MGLRSHRRKQSWAKKLIVMSLFLSVGLVAFQFIQTTSNQEFKPLIKGDRIPKHLNYTCMNNQSFNLLNATQEKPVVLVYYQSTFRNYCITHLNELNQIEPDIQTAGYQLIAVSPDSPTVLANAQKDNKLTYLLVSDTRMEGAKQFGILDQDDERTLPKPSVFIINKRGNIIFAHTDTDYEKRLSTDAILGIL